MRVQGSPSDFLHEAVRAPGNWEIDAAWPRIAALVSSQETEKELLLAAHECSLQGAREKNRPFEQVQKGQAAGLRRRAL